MNLKSVYFAGVRAIFLVVVFFLVVVTIGNYNLAYGNIALHNKYINTAATKHKVNHNGCFVEAMHAENTTAGAATDLHDTA